MFKTIVTHRRPHFDEFVAIWLLVKFGEFVFGGISQALVEFWEEDRLAKSPKEYEQEGVILVGIGGGRFDEHGKQNAERKMNMCAATLVAKELGLDEDDALKPLINFATRRDLKAAISDGARFELPEMVKTMYRVNTAEMKVWQWTFDAIQAIYDDATVFYERASQDFEKARAYSIQNSRGKVPVVVGTSDVENFSKYARSAHGSRAGIVIQINTTGNLQIQTASRYRLDMSDTIRALRVEELKLKRYPPPDNWQRFWDELAREENIPGCPEWYYHHEGQMILNGSLTKDAPPTSLPIQQIEKLVQIGIDHRAFAPSRQEVCRTGRCTSSDDNRCPWHSWGLPRCRTLRGEIPVPNSIRPA
ncbi:MAG TPA: hypothetical protein VMT81_02835 [Candidatus Paceibacterota bacterium]|nr:hypothetical protein [Candidatus Paceibacterota bacterium]